MLGKASPQFLREADTRDFLFNKQYIVKDVLWKKTKQRDKTDYWNTNKPILKKTGSYMQALIITGEAGSYPTLWYKNVISKSYSKIMAISQEVYAIRLGHWHSI